MSSSYKYDLSVIIVNYNVEYFLDQCLDSVQKASSGLIVEIIVVDNNSIDGSMQMVSKKYPNVKTIINDQNTGFSVANNQAIQIAEGEYVLLLNPDTVVGEDTFVKCLSEMRSNENYGALGIRMIDGKGNFLPESKRGLPTPMVAFYKIFGLSRIFPKSKRFGQYHAGHIEETQTAKTDILSGAFMLFRKEALDKIGLLDETFFMYGEDIDISYRITQAGYENVYFADSSIIHYKGESTKKSSVNYVFVFYRAMIIFAAKHFAGDKAKLFSIIINLAIYLRAGMAIVSRFIKAAFLPFIDFLYLTFGMFALTSYWENKHIYFPEEVTYYLIPSYALIWIAFSFLQGGYDPPVRLYKYFKGTILGLLLILLIYATLPKSVQFSRLFIFIGAAWTICYFLISRIFLHFAVRRKFKLKSSTSSSFLVVSNQNEFDRISQFLSKTHDQVITIENANQLEENSDIEIYDEIIFSSADYSYQDIIQNMIILRGKDVKIKIAPKEVNYLIGSNSIDTAGDLYILNLNALDIAENKRKKRLFDFILSLSLLVSFPFIMLSFNNKGQLFKNVLSVFTGRKSFIGFSQETRLRDVRLPQIKEGILHPSDSLPIMDHGFTEKINLLYTRDYSMRKDLSIILKAWAKLDR